MGNTVTYMKSAKVSMPEGYAVQTNAHQQVPESDTNGLDLFRSTEDRGNVRADPRQFLQRGQRQQYSRHSAINAQTKIRTEEDRPPTYDEVFYGLTLMNIPHVTRYNGVRIDSNADAERSSQNGRQRASPPTSPPPRAKGSKGLRQPGVAAGSTLTAEALMQHNAAVDNGEFFAPLRRSTYSLISEMQDEERQRKERRKRREQDPGWRQERRVREFRQREAAGAYEKW